MEINQIISKQLVDNPVVLYMKGTPQFPQCGFSAIAADILAKCGLDHKQYLSINVLLEPELRQGIKEHANWPTIPQLYLNGEFVGGADVLKTMYESGDLQQLIDKLATQPVN